MRIFDRVMRLMLEPDEEKKGSQGVDEFPADAVIGLGFVGVVVIVVGFLLVRYLRLGGVNSLLGALGRCLSMFGFYSFVGISLLERLGSFVCWHFLAGFSAAST